jgi:outer membrane protein TolC
LVEVEDTARRLRVVSGALLPQAESAYRSVLGTYAAGKAGVAQVLLAQQTVLELKVAQTEASADHARAWAALESRCGQALERHPISEEP